ncbi:hypothetical protein GCM10011289_01230 [Paludibacterium paludis]|uniref:Pseudouridine synthase n=1 Tax=Paludibacterium paludis TaxID=1225769 RepID=A0A918U7D5_9NEIS|nr:hypothetical protein GCM10011289_01230 [Paludibacterium paludis]
MSKGQRNHDRQPAARVRGREDASQSRFDGQAPRNPANSKPGGSLFIRSANRNAPAPQEGRAPFSREGQRRGQGAGNNGERQPSNRDGQRDFGRNGNPGENRRFNRDERQPFNRDGQRDFGRNGNPGENRRFNRDERQPFNRDGQRDFGRNGNPGENRRFNRDERQPFNRDGQRDFGRNGNPGENRRFNRDERQPSNRDSQRDFFGHQDRQSAERDSQRDFFGRNDRRDDNRRFNRDERQPSGRDGQRDDGRRFGRDTSPKVARAKKMLVREPNQKVQDQNRRLRETRVASDEIEPVRLQKALANSGCGSRREMEEWIEAGLVTINGKTASLGDKVTPQDRVVAKGHAVKLKWPDRLPRVILYHKTEGEMVTRDDPQGRVTVFDRLPQAKSSRWIAIGRLDVNTSGLLVLTTSGELANSMMHPSFEVEREYAVRVLGELTDEQRRELCREIELDDGPARFERIVDQGGEGANHWYRVVIKEGRNREVRRMFEFFNLQVSRLMRVRFGNIALPPRLKRGQYYELNEVEAAAVMKWAGLKVPGRGR